jgi:HME family heavy-metal exporter
VAVTILGGLISSTLLDTLLTPILFLRFGRAPLERLLAAREPESPHAGPRPAEVF